MVKCAIVCTNFIRSRFLRCCKCRNCFFRCRQYFVDIRFRSRYDCIDCFFIADCFVKVSACFRNNRLNCSPTRCRVVRFRLVCCKLSLRCCYNCFFSFYNRRRLYSVHICLCSCNDFSNCFVVSDRFVEFSACRCDNRLDFRPLCRFIIRFRLVCRKLSLRFRYNCFRCFPLRNRLHCINSRFRFVYCRVDTRYGSSRIDFRICRRNDGLDSRPVVCTVIAFRLISSKFFLRRYLQTFEDSVRFFLRYHFVHSGLCISKSDCNFFLCRRCVDCRIAFFDNYVEGSPFFSVVVCFYEVALVLFKFRLRIQLSQLQFANPSFARIYKLAFRNHVFHCKVCAVEGTADNQNVAFLRQARQVKEHVMREFYRRIDRRAVQSNAQAALTNVERRRPVYVIFGANDGNSLAANGCEVYLRQPVRICKAYEHQFADFIRGIIYEYFPRSTVPNKACFFNGIRRQKRFACEGTADGNLVTCFQSTKEEEQTSGVRTLHFKQGCNLVVNLEVIFAFCLEEIVPRLNGQSFFVCRKQIELVVYIASAAPRLTIYVEGKRANVVRLRLYTLFRPSGAVPYEGTFFDNVFNSKRFAVEGTADCQLVIFFREKRQFDEEIAREFHACRNSRAIQGNATFVIAECRRPVHVVFRANNRNSLTVCAVEVSHVIRTGLHLFEFQLAEFIRRIFNSGRRFGFLRRSIRFPSRTIPL